MMPTDEEHMQGAVQLGQRLCFYQCRDVPAETVSVHYFSTDDLLRYDAFYEDFGPLNLSKLYRYIEMIKKKSATIALMKKKIVHCCSLDPRMTANAAWLAGAYMILEHGQSPESLNALFKNARGWPFLPFRDASQAPSSFDLTLLDCFRGLKKARDLRYFDFSSFDLWEYEHYEQVEHGDWNIITPKFIAFSGPAAVKKEIYPGLYTMVPWDYFDMWRRKNVSAVVRLNKRSYDAQDFVNAGFNHYDLFFVDGSCPPEHIARKFLEVAEQEKGVLAIHCKAGLGRTGTLIGLYCMKHEGFTAREFIAWNRIVRPGSVIGPQQQFLIDWEYKLRTESEALRVSNSIGSALNKASSVYHETPAGMGGFVRSKMRSLKIVS